MSRCLKHANRNTYDAANVAIRTGQCVLAILVAALSGVDLGRWSRSGGHADSRWIYAEVASVLSTLTAFACGFRQRRAKSTASLVLCVFCHALLSLLWVVVSAVYGQLVVSDSAAAELDFTRSAVEMAVAASSISAVLWFVDAVAACSSSCRKGKAEKVDAEEQGGQGLEGNSGVVGLQGTETKGAQEMKDQGNDALPPYSEG
ncbi:hypothetical protein BBO_03474 [Beauveria brongniartii RCEF 3172]|uniref:Uncharacterized protein n=1 Tax=Beauveria brongniartii RCEF 3172 TaxID=1081107 RepID=A0A162JQZ2_9HYPO|nr:hypothetical protein BBO_03474 [Beauveria brongniartii RCEF 3172]